MEIFIVFLAVRPISTKCFNQVSNSGSISFLVTTIRFHLLSHHLTTLHSSGLCLYTHTSWGANSILRPLLWLGRFLSCSDCQTGKILAACYHPPPPLPFFSLLPKGVCIGFETILTSRYENADRNSETSGHKQQITHSDCWGSGQSLRCIYCGEPVHENWGWFVVSCRKGVDSCHQRIPVRSLAEVDLERSSFRSLTELGDTKMSPILSINLMWK